MKRRIESKSILLAKSIHVAMRQAAALKREYPEGRMYANQRDEHIFRVPQYHRYHGGPHWAVVRTAFHGGGIVSRHYTDAAAHKAAKRIATGDCTCGCAGVVRRDRLADLESVDRNSSWTHDPYALVI